MRINTFYYTDTNTKIYKNAPQTFYFNQLHFVILCTLEMSRLTFLSQPEPEPNKILITREFEEQTILITNWSLNLLNFSNPVNCEKYFRYPRLWLKKIIVE